MKIDDDIPLFRAARKRGTPLRGVTRTIRALRAGQSVFLPDRSSGYASTITGRIRAKVPGAKYVIRSVNGGVRVWCLEYPDASEIDALFR